MDTIIDASMMGFIVNIAGFVVSVAGVIIAWKTYKQHI